MPANTPRGYTYATADDANDVPLVSQRLAEQIDADVAAIAAGLIDTGDLVDGSSPDPIASFGSGWAGLTGSGWTGIHVRRYGPIVMIVGAAAKGSWGNLETMFTLASGFRPWTQIQGNGCQVTVDGQVKANTAGSTATSFSAMFFRATA